MTDIARWVTGGLILVNQVLAATIVLTSFSLLIYLLTHNFRSVAARAFCAILAFVLVVYVGDVALVEAKTQPATVHWLRFQWIGIALVPAAYLDFSDALLRTTHTRVRWQRPTILVSYALSLAFLALVYGSSALVSDTTYRAGTTVLAAGPLFWVFAAYYMLTVIWGATNIRQARKRCLTRASRRRMSYLGLAFAAPAAGVFPYLMLTSLPLTAPTNLLRLVLLFGNAGVLSMIVLMAYSVAYFGALTPDRVIRHNLIHYLLRGPVVGAALIFTMLAVPKVQQILGLPRDTVLIFAVVGVLVLLQLIINRAKPVIDRAIYREDRDEITWIQTLDRRLLTSADLGAFLENTLAALCDLMQVRTAFVASKTGDRVRAEAQCGDRLAVYGFLAEYDIAAPPTPNIDRDARPLFTPVNGFWLVPLHSSTADTWLGTLGVEARAQAPDLSPDEQELATLLIRRAEEALEDRTLQQGVFDALRGILPDIERLHQWQDATQYGGPQAEPSPAGDPVYSPEFQRWVKEALSHYWGGPRLTESPLVGLRIVREVMREQHGSSAHALRLVLNLAIERLRPGGEQKMTASEWLLYNIVEMKFVRGLRVQDIARRLAMSESDLYRKQRVAIAEVARALADLEQNGTGLPAENPVQADSAGRGADRRRSV